MLNELLGWWKRKLCKHEFVLEDLRQTGISDPPPPGNNSYEAWMMYHTKYYCHPSYYKRVMWPCRKCGKVFYAHCGLDISPDHGPVVRPNAEWTPK